MSGATPVATAARDRATPTFEDVLAAREVVARYIRPTPFRESLALGRALGVRLFVKHENHQPTSAFKVRGNINKVLSLSPEQVARGVVTASMGNHGQGMCFAARIAGTSPTVVMPREANPDKADAMRDLGAEVLFHGADFEEANVHARELEAQRGLTYFHAADDAKIIAGHGTVGLEMLEEVPDLDVLVVPVGAGGLISGTALAAKSLNPDVRVVGVQAKSCAPYYTSRELGRLVEAPSANTFAEGLAARFPTPLPFRMIAELVDELIVVSEEEMRRAIVLLIHATHNLAEGAGAAGTAGVVKLAGELVGARFGTILSGGNLTVEQLKRVLMDAESWD